MAFAAKILADSISPHDVRLTTFEITFPRYILAELNTHRVLSRCSASSRANPVEKVLRRLAEDPYVPVKWGRNQRGMQADTDLTPEQQQWAADTWLRARNESMKHAAALRDMEVHKQDANRILEPWMWHTAIVAGTEWENFWHLRDHRDAHPAFRTVVTMMRELFDAEDPNPLRAGQWHLPLTDDLNDGVLRTTESVVKISAGRCARVSYLSHDGKRDLNADIELCDRLLKSGHMSPLEMPARPLTKDDIAAGKLPLLAPVGAEALPSNTWAGNYRGWVQYRKTVPHEHDALGPR